MIFSIYRKLRRDFSLLKEYGYKYSGKFRHYVQPSIEFKRKNSNIQIGFNYESNRIYLYIYKPKCIDILENEIGFEKLSYKEQLEKSLTILKDYLQVDRMV